MTEKTINTNGNIKDRHPGYFRSTVTNREANRNRGAIRGRYKNLSANLSGCGMICSTGESNKKNKGQLRTEKNSGLFLQALCNRYKTKIQPNIEVQGSNGPEEGTIAAYE